MVLAPFAETKGARLPGRTPATQNITVIREFGKRSDSFTDQGFSPGKSQDTFPINMRLLYGQNHNLRMIPFSSQLRRFNPFGCPCLNMIIGILPQGLGSIQGKDLISNLPNPHFPKREFQWLPHRKLWGIASSIIQFWP
jgi:hypothetical protein